MGRLARVVQGGRLKIFSTKSVRGFRVHSWRHPFFPYRPCLIPGLASLFPLAQSPLGDRMQHIHCCILLSSMQLKISIATRRSEAGCSLSV